MNWGSTDLCIRRCLICNDRKSTYQNFIDFIYELLDQSIFTWQRNSRHYPEYLGEVALSHLFLRDFLAYGIEASAETDNNGHCDITIELKSKRWVWLGESKIHSDYDYLMKGTNQLFGRYSVDDEYQEHGGLIIFIYAQKAALVLKRWREYISTNRDDCSCTQDCSTRPHLSFISMHPEHPKSGLPYYIKHIGIIMNAEHNDDAYISKPSK